MKIFLSFLQSEKNHPIPSYSFWEYYVKNGIEEAGFEWIECPDVDWALGLVPQTEEDFAKWKADAWGKTIAYLKKHPADIFLSYLYPLQIEVPAIKEIQRSGIPCVNFFCDHIRDFEKLPVEFGIFNNNWVPEYKATRLYEKAGYPFINLPMPMWVDPKYRKLRDENNQCVTFVGSKDIQRVLLLEGLLKNDPKIPLAIYGAGWTEDLIPQHRQTPDYTIRKKIQFNADYLKKHGVAAFLRKIKHRKLSYYTTDVLTSKTHSSPSFETYNDLLAGSMVTLGVNRYESFGFPLDRPNSYSRLRDIEAPMLGACYLTEYTDGLEEMYDLETEIWVYHDADDLSAQVRRLVADPAKRLELKTNGQKKALDVHNIPNSLKKILKRVLQ